jgi:hypothetical protein
MHFYNCRFDDNDPLANQQGQKLVNGSDFENFRDMGLSREDVTQKIQKNVPCTLFPEVFSANYEGNLWSKW